MNLEKDGFPSKDQEKEDAQLHREMLDDKDSIHHPQHDVIGVTNENIH